MQVVSLIIDVIIAAPKDRSYRTVIVIGIMVSISGLLKFVQEFKSGKAAEKLKAFVRTTAAVLRKDSGIKEINMSEIVPGDIVHFAAAQKNDIPDKNNFSVADESSMVLMGYIAFLDPAKESADIILLEKNLMVLEERVIEGRNVFGNIIKYIKMTVSSNFANVFSVLVASAFLLFLPILPIQLLLQNLFYDISQTSIPWDSMDEEYIRKPRKWNADDIGRFMVCRRTFIPDTYYPHDQN